MYVLEVTVVRYREQYNAGHSFISWSLMINQNLLKLAHEDGHSVQTMLTTYAAWINATHPKTSCVSNRRWSSRRLVRPAP